MKLFSPQKFKKHSGFTLIEVLVASVILFSVLASVTLIYKGAYISSEKASRHIVVDGLMPIFLNQIRNNIREQGNKDLQELSGQNTLWGMNYEWKAVLLSFKAPPDYFDPDSGKMSTSQKKYKLWEVELNVSNDKAGKTYKYKELSWNDT